MKYIVKEIETALESGKLWNWSDAGVGWQLGKAYLNAKETGNEIPDFGFDLWTADPTDLIADCRKHGVNEITISGTGGSDGLFRWLAIAEEKGCHIDGLVKVKDRYLHFGRKERDLIPAIKITIN